MSVLPMLAQASAAPAASQAVTVALVLSAALFTIGLVGFLVRRNMILMFLCTELMLQAASLAFIAFGRMRGDTGGQVFVIFILTVAAAESAIGLAILVLLFRNKSSIRVDELNELRG